MNLGPHGVQGWFDEPAPAPVARAEALSDDARLMSVYRVHRSEVENREA